MSAYDFSKRNVRHGAPIAAPSAFDTAKGNKKVHVKPGDPNMIFNPRTNRYVKADGAIGQAVLEEFGYPEQMGGREYEDQEGGYSFADLNNQISQSFSDLYRDLSSAWTNLTSDKSATKTKGKGTKGAKGKASNKRPSNLY